MTFKDIFPISYATICGVQLGESFVKRPENIGAGEWMSFWAYVIDDPGRMAVSKYEDEIASANAEIERLESKIEDIEQENDDLRAENRDYERRIDDLEEKIAKLSEDCLQADYALTQKFGEKV